MKVYISSSWKNRERVRAMAERLEEMGHNVYDFTNTKCRKCQEIPPGTTADFNPERHDYREYINWKLFRDAVYENRKAIDECDLVVLLLPCGNDSHVDWAYGVGRGKPSVIVGHPMSGGQSPTHLWADMIVANDESFYMFLDKMEEDKY